MDFWRSVNTDGSDHNVFFAGTNSSSTCCHLCGVRPKNIKQSRDKRDQPIVYKPNGTVYIKERSSGARSCGTCTNNTTIAQRKSSDDRVRIKIPELQCSKPAVMDGPVEKVEDPIGRGRPSQGSSHYVAGMAIKSADKTEADELLREADRHKTDRFRLEQQLKRMDEDLTRLQNEQNELLLRIDDERKKESEKQARAFKLLSSHEQKTTAERNQKSSPPSFDGDTRTTEQKANCVPAARDYCTEERCKCGLSTAAPESLRSGNASTIEDRIRRELPQPSYVGTGIATAVMGLDLEKPRPPEVVTSSKVDRGKLARPDKTFASKSPEKPCSAATRTAAEKNYGSEARAPTDRRQTERELSCDSLCSSSSQSSSDVSSVDAFWGPMPTIIKKPFEASDCVGDVCGYVPRKTRRGQKNEAASEKNWCQSTPASTRRLPNGNKDVFTWGNETSSGRP